MPAKRDPKKPIDPRKRKAGYITESKKRNVKQGITLAPVRKGS